MGQLTSLMLLASLDKLILAASRQVLCLGLHIGLLISCICSCVIPVWLVLLSILTHGQPGPPPLDSLPQIPAPCTQSWVLMMNFELDACAGPSTSPSD